MFGYFGKGVVAPPPTTPPTTPGTIPLLPISPMTTAGDAALTAEEGVAEEVPNQGLYQPATGTTIPANEGPTENDIIRSRLQALQASIAAKKAEQEAKVQAVQAMQAKQAAYGRDTQQVRPKEAGYATESEKIMGGQTGYGNYSPYGYFGQTTVDQAASEVQQATKVVERLTYDVKKGMATKSELKAAMDDLSKKIDIAKEVAKQAGLSGYGNDTSKSWSPLWIIVVIGIAWFFLKPKKV